MIIPHFKYYRFTEKTASARRITENDNETERKENENVSRIAQSEKIVSIKRTFSLFQSVYGCPQRGNLNTLSIDIMQLQFFHTQFWLRLFFALAAENCVVF